MKKTTVILIAVLFCTLDTSAQYNYTSIISSTTIPNVDNGRRCPIRGWTSTKSVAAVKKDSTTTAFCLIDHSGFITTYLPPVVPPNISSQIAFRHFLPPVSDFTVNDLFIADDYAFFCGSINHSKAFYGYFDLNTFGTNISIFTIDPYPDLPPITLTKLVAYKDGGTYKVVAIGDDTEDHYTCYSLVVEVFDATGTPSCRVARMPAGPAPYIHGQTQKLFLHDIILTDNYVIMLGHDDNLLATGIGYPWFCVGGRANVVGDICDPIINHNFYLANLREANDAVVGVALDDDMFAMAYVFFDEVDLRYYTRLRVIDPNNLTNTHSQQFLKSQKENPVEMIYMPESRLVELLQPILDSSDYITLAPNATVSYTTTVLTPDGRTYQSLNHIKGPAGKSFISSRSGTIYLDNLAASIPHSDISCPKCKKQEIQMIKELPISKAPCATEITNPVSLFDFSTWLNASEFLNNNCFSVE